MQVFERLSQNGMNQDIANLQPSIQAPDLEIEGIKIQEDYVIEYESALMSLQSMHFLPNPCARKAMNICPKRRIGKRQNLIVHRYTSNKI